MESRVGRERQCTMSLVNKLIGFGLRQVIGDVIDHVGDFVEMRFTDHSQTLPKALARANDRAWQALGIALAGDTFVDKLKVLFASGDDKGIREQVRRFLQDKTIGFEGTPAEFRKISLAELNQARKAGLLSAQNLIAREVGQQAAKFQRYADPKGMVDGAEQVVRQIADDLAYKYSNYPNLAKLLRQRPASGGPPLLVSAFAYFFRREVESDDALARGLFFDGLRALSASQAKGFAEVDKALTSLGDQFERVFQQLDRIEAVVVETQAVAVETHGAVLDMQAELQRLGSWHIGNADEVRRLLQEVSNRVSQAGMQKGEVKSQHGFSIRSEDERAAVKQLLARFRQLPVQQQHHVPALRNGLGKLQFGSADFDGARQTFVTVAAEVHDAAAQAEAQYNAYRAALEEKKWSEALAAIQQAAALDSQRFAPFPIQRYQVKRILGAGGFGTAFLCHDRNFDEEVVVKTLHETAMERNMTEVFREARLLRKLNHPAIIGVHECEYADPLKHARPYIVMDYFPGGSLENFIQQRGTISPEDMIVVGREIANGMKAAHQQNILHRDLKPDNILIRKEGPNWKVKIIDFGLALGKQTIETSMAARPAGSTVLSDSVAGTVKYAPPEQMGEMKGVKPGPYSDVYAFGKMCCYALFKTTEPTDRLWKMVSEGIRTDLREMLDQCREKELEHRLPSFEPVLKVLEGLDPIQTRRKKEEEVRRLPVGLIAQPRAGDRLGVVDALPAVCVPMQPAKVDPFPFRGAGRDASDKLTYATENIKLPARFYLGREYDLTQKRVLDKPVMYDARDLTTHGVVVGMSGSGKTGLCINILEEAAIDGIPSIIVDLKGEMVNLLLQFENLKPEDFEAWTNPEDARRNAISEKEYAQQNANKWRQGLADWGQTPERVALLKNAAERRIYTPGSEAGLPLSILGTFAAPRGRVPREEMNQKIASTATALLGLTRNIARQMGNSQVSRIKTMPNRKPTKATSTRKRTDTTAGLRKALTGQSKAELVSVLLELAQVDRKDLRHLLTARFGMTPAPTELIGATRRAIGDATKDRRKKTVGASCRL